MKRVAQTGLVLLAIGCALVLSATATVEYVALVGVPGWAQPAAVGMLEVVAVTGTWLWVTDRRMRNEAMAAVLLASVVTGYAGWHAYGAFGLVAPAGLIVTVHLVARAWTAVTDHPPREPIVFPPLDEVAEGSPDWWATAPPVDEPRVQPSAEALIAAGVGRRRLAQRLGVSEHEARRRIAAYHERETAPTAA